MINKFEKVIFSWIDWTSVSKDAISLHVFAEIRIAISSEQLFTFHHYAMNLMFQKMTQEKGAIR